MRIFLCGQKYFGWAVLKMLEARPDTEVVGVSAPAGDRLHQYASHSDIRAVLPSGSLSVETMPSGVDLIIAAHSHDYIGLKTLATTTLGGIGYHPSLLPLHRGRDAIRWTLRFGDKVTGGSVYWLSKNVDGGAIAAQEWCFVPPGWDATKLWRERLQPMGIRLLAQTLDDLDRGKIVAVPQDERLATWEPALDQPPIYRPDLPRIGNVPGFEVVSSSYEWDEAARLPWQVLAGT